MRSSEPSGPCAGSCSSVLIRVHPRHPWFILSFGSDGRAVVDGGAATGRRRSCHAARLPRDAVWSGDACGAAERRARREKENPSPQPPPRSGEGEEESRSGFQYPGCVFLSPPLRFGEGVGGRGAFPGSERGASPAWWCERGTTSCVSKGASRRGCAGPPSRRRRRAPHRGGRRGDREGWSRWRAHCGQRGCRSWWFPGFRGRAGAGWCADRRRARASGWRSCGAAYGSSRDGSSCARRTAAVTARASIPGLTWKRPMLPVFGSRVRRRPAKRNCQPNSPAARGNFFARANGRGA